MLALVAVPVWIAAINWVFHASGRDPFAHPIEALHPVRWFHAMLGVFRGDIEMTDWEKPRFVLLNAAMLGFVILVDLGAAVFLPDTP